MNLRHSAQAVRALPFALLVLLSPSMHGQEPCSAHTLTQRYLMEQGLPTDIGNALAKLPKGQAKGGGPLVIPVVVHVVWNISADNVPDATIQAMVATMNNDFQGTNPDFNSVRPAFTGVRGIPNVTFCLATVDPNGNPTTGITRTQTSDTWFDPDTETNDMKAPPTGKSPWDPDSYLNIWICDISSGLGGGLITTGYAYLPVGGMVGSAIDGIVIDCVYGLDAGSRTASHEAGHYLGLQHPWGTNGGCVDDDGFADTPDTDGPTFSCSPNNQTSCGVLTQYENFMDYSSCQCMFTLEQSAEVVAIVSGVRSTLLSSAGCGTVPSGPCIPTSANGTGDGDYVDGVVLGSIVNTGSGGPTAPTYSDLSAIESTLLARGLTYGVTITGGTYVPDHYAAWIDYDQDDVFEATEKLGEFTTSLANETQTLSFTVPANAPLGTTRMRVRGVYHNTGEPSPTDPCFSYAWGETEDYGIEITNTASGPCIPVSANGTVDGDFIDGVVLGDIVNTATGGTGGPSYTDHVNETTDLAIGLSYSIAITSGDYTPDHYAAWIDYDQDDQFEAGEKLGEFVTTALFQTQNIPFTVPSGAQLGTTVLRVRGVYHNTGEPSPTDPCYAYAWGETEDYGVNIGISTDIQASDDGSVLIRPTAEGLLVMSVDGSDLFQGYHLLDAAGRLLAQGRCEGARTVIPKLSLGSGVHVLRLFDGERSLAFRFPVVR